MFEVTMGNQPGSFFTDRDPTRPEGWEISSGFVGVEVAHFEDNFTPQEQNKREDRALRALREGETRPRRIHVQYVATVTTIPDEARTFPTRIRGARST
jgi:hypothetical protein